MSKEKWKRVAQEKGYLISSWGRVFSLKSERIIRPYVHKSRANMYLRITLNGTKYMVHILVPRNFKQNDRTRIAKENNCSKLDLQVNHMDRNTLNPHYTNVEWITESDNKIHMHETSIITFGGKTYKGKFNECD